MVHKKVTLGLLLMLVVLTPVLYAQAKPVVIVTGEWAPYTSEMMDGQGFFTEVVSAVFKEMGVQTKIEFVPWARAEEMVKAGTAFAAMPYVVNDERKASFDFSDQVANSTGKFFVLQDGNVPKTFDWKVYTDLKAFFLGGVTGYWYEKEFKASGLKVEYTDTEESNVKKLYAKRVDLITMDELVGWQLIKKLYPTELAKFRTVLNPTNLSELKLMVSRKYPDSKATLTAFNTSLAKIKKNGVYAAILKKYNLSN